jgi:hypothetical protein
MALTNGSPLCRRRPATQSNEDLLLDSGPPFAINRSKTVTMGMADR